MRKRVIASLFAACLLVVGACGGGDEGEGGGETTDSGADNGGAEPLPVTITAKNFAFDQDTITAHATHEVDLTFVNEDTTVHSFTIEDLDVDVEAEGGAEATATFTPDEIGTFEFKCRFHPAMTGELKVE